MGVTDSAHSCSYRCLCCSLCWQCSCLGEHIDYRSIGHFATYSASPALYEWAPTWIRSGRSDMDRHSPFSRREKGLRLFHRWRVIVYLSEERDKSQHLCPISPSSPRGKTWDFLLSLLPWSENNSIQWYSGSGKKATPQILFMPFLIYPQSFIENLADSVSIDVNGTTVCVLKERNGMLWQSRNKTILTDFSNLNMQNTPPLPRTASKMWGKKHFDRVFVIGKWIYQCILMVEGENNDVVEVYMR